MKITFNDHPETILAFNGDLIGGITEADTDAGYVIQIQPDGSLFRRDGRVDVLDHTVHWSPELVAQRQEKLIDIRRELGWPAADLMIGF